MKLKITFKLSVFLIIYGSVFNSIYGQQNNWISEIALQEGVHPNLVYAVMNQESDFRPGIISAKGAIGLMQLMSETARRFKVNPYNMEENVRGGCRYLRFLLSLFGGRLDLTLAAYNAGEGAVVKYGYQIPPYYETQNYVAKILNSLQIRFNPTPKQSPRKIISNPKRTENNLIQKENASGKETVVRKTASSFLF